MNIKTLLAYSDQVVMQPLLMEVSVLLLKVIYGEVERADIDRAKNLVYNAGIEADWLEILAEGNPDYVSDVIEQVHFDLCLSEETSLALSSIADIFIIPDNLPTQLDLKDACYLASEFGVEYEDGEFYEFDNEGEIE